MKRKSTFLLFAFLMSVCFTLYSQTWTAPSLTFSTLTSGTTYYVYNVGSDGYLSRGGYWYTQAILEAISPKLSSSSSLVKWTAVNTSGSTWTFQYNNVAGNYLFAADPNPVDGSVYTDNSTNNTWDVVLTDATAKTYSIQVVSSYGGYISTQYLGSASTTESTNRGSANTVRYNRASGDNYTQWKFASQEDMDLYNAKVLLDRYMNYAKIKGGINISSYITTYNAGVTADINTAAADLLTALGRTDLTTLITNPSFETAAQAGWTNNAGYFVNQNNTSLCTKDGTNYTEKWGDAQNLLTGSTITQTISGLANGLYGMVASGIARGGIHTGVFFKAGTNDSTEVGPCGNYNVDYIAVTNATSGNSDGTLTIGLTLSGTIACNWVGFDNFRLYYYGTPATKANIANSKNVTVKPTISSDNFKVEFANKLGKISVYDLSGRLVLDRKATQSIEEISVPGKGVYFIKTNVADEVRTFKVVKN
jgi:hypothetical protein